MKKKRKGKIIHREKREAQNKNGVLIRNLSKKTNKIYEKGSVIYGNSIVVIEGGCQRRGKRL